MLHDVRQNTVNALAFHGWLIALMLTMGCGLGAIAGRAILIGLSPSVDEACAHILQLAQEEEPTWIEAEFQLHFTHQKHRARCEKRLQWMEREIGAFRSARTRRCWLHANAMREAWACFEQDGLL